MSETEEVLREETLMRLKSPLQRAFIGFGLILSAFPASFLFGTLARSYLSPLTFLGLLAAATAMVWVAFDSNYVHRNRLGLAALLIVVVLTVIAVTTSFVYLYVAVVGALLTLGVLVTAGAWIALASVDIDGTYRLRMWSSGAALMTASTLWVFAIMASTLREEAILLAFALVFCGTLVFARAMRHVSRRSGKGRLERRWTWCVRWLGSSVAFSLAPFVQSLAEGESVSEMYWPDALIWVLVVGCAVALGACTHFVFAMRSTIEVIDGARR